MDETEFKQLAVDEPQDDVTPSSGSTGGSDESSDEFEPVRVGRFSGLAAAVAASSRRKSLESILEESARDQENGNIKLTLLDLLCIGIGSTIGSGVFVLTGDVLPVAGPSSILCWILGGLACLLSAFAYMELSAVLPTKGSCYVFSYHCLGEVVGVVGAVCLTLEYAVSGAGVARSWSGKLAELMGPRAQSVLFTYWGPAVYTTVTRSSGEQDVIRIDDNYLDWPAAFLTALCSLIVLRGLDMGKVIINAFTFAKIALVVMLIILGFTAGSVDVFADFFPFGASGTLKGTTKVFFGFIGFDEVCCMAAKAKNPSKVMPRALAGTLFGAAFFSGLAQWALASMVSCYEGMTAVSFEQAFVITRGWTWAQRMTSIGELCLLPLVVLLSILPQPEVTAAMSEDKLLPSIFMRANVKGIYFKGTAIIGLVTTIVALAIPFSWLWNVISLGVLLGFNLTNAALISLRCGNGGKLRHPRAMDLVWALFLTSGVAAYSLWHGFVDCAMNSSSSLQGSDSAWCSSAWATALTCFGILSVLMSVALLMRLRFAFMIDHSANDLGLFRVPGVPFVPGVAMLINFFLMAQLTFQDHVLLAIVCMVFLFSYFAYKCLKRAYPRSSFECEESPATSE
eukprot:TRINITY_DN28882_c0_g1_i1.p1 TRINITY_DN28882_c0_g1~~TRINITY_DN28882_c0_g1_i1.p1  ORF type:complete len:633 (-),score=77.00 TRINITY_DN28882_c0_g1_i1:57-1928(-)